MTPEDIDKATTVEDPIVYQIRANRKGFDNEIDIAIMSVHPQVAVCEELKMRAIEPGEEVQPLMTIVFEEAVGLMTDLWDAGVRPEGVDLADSKTLIAVQAHLNDIRMFATAFWNKMSGGAPPPDMTGKKEPNEPTGAGPGK